MATSGHVSHGTELRAEEGSMDITAGWDPGPSHFPAQSKEGTFRSVIKEIWEASW